MLIDKLQLLKIPDSLEAALEYVGTERWVCWYWDDEETLLLEDINSSSFGNSEAWLLFCSYMNTNNKVDLGSSYDYFQSLVSGQYSSEKGHEAETKVTENLSLSNEQKAYLFDRQNRELYSGSPSNIQTLIKQPKTLVMWAELQGQNRNNIGFESDLSLLKPTLEEWALTEGLTDTKPQKKLFTALFKLIVVWFGAAVILPVPWASAMHLLQSVSSHFPINHSTDSIEKLKLDLALKNQTTKLFGKKETLEGSKKQKSECKTHTD